MKNILILIILLLLNINTWGQSLCPPNEITTNPDAPLNNQNPAMENIFFDWRIQNFDNYFTPNFPYPNGDLPPINPYWSMEPYLTYLTGWQGTGLPQSPDVDYSPIEGWELITRGFGRFINGNSDHEFPEKTFNVAGSMLDLDNACLSSPDITNDLWSSPVRKLFVDIYNDKLIQLQTKKAAYSNSTVGTPEENILKGEISDLSNQLNDVVSRTVNNHLLRDDKALELDSIRNLWTSIPSVDIDYLLAESYAQEGNQTLTNQILNNIPIDNNLDSNTNAIHQKYLNLKTLQQTILNSNRTFDDLDPIELANIKTMAFEEPNKVTTKSQSWLDFYYEMDFESSIKLPEAAAQRNEIQTTKSEGTPLITLSASPNPASDEVTFYFSNIEKTGKGIISIQDLNGKIVHQININPDVNYTTWTTMNTKKGIYFYSLILDNNIIETKKLILIK